MADKLLVHKNRTNIVTADLGMDVSGDIITGEIRTKPETDSPLVCTWQIEFTNDGSDGLLTLTLDDMVTSQIQVELGYMDLKRDSGGEPLPVFDRPLEVVFQTVVTE